MIRRRAAASGEVSCSGSKANGPGFSFFRASSAQGGALLTLGPRGVLALAAIYIGVVATMHVIGKIVS